jgi:hypothetical protein
MPASDSETRTASPDRSLSRMLDSPSCTSYPRLVAAAAQGFNPSFTVPPPLVTRLEIEHTLQVARTFRAAQARPAQVRDVSCGRLHAHCTCRSKNALTDRLHCGRGGNRTRRVSRSTSCAISHLRAQTRVLLRESIRRDTTSYRPTPLGSAWDCSSRAMA